MRFLLPVPPSTNNLYANPIAGKGRRRKTPRYREWSREAGTQITLQRRGQKLPEPPFLLDCWLYFPDDERRRDATNFIKAPEDLLSEVFGFDDKDVIDASAHRRSLADHPELDITPLCVVILLASPRPDIEEWGAALATLDGIIGSHGEAQRSALAGEMLNVNTRSGVVMGQAGEELEVGDLVYFKEGKVYRS